MMRVTRASLPKKLKLATKKCLMTNVELVKVDSPDSLDSLDSPDSPDSPDSLDSPGSGEREVWRGEIGLCVTIINNYK